MKNSELSQSLTPGEYFFDALKLLAIVGTAGGFFCLYRYFNSRNTSGDRPLIENDNHTVHQNPQKKGAVYTVTPSTPNLATDGQMVVAEQPSGATFHTTNTNIGSVFNINNATFVLEGLPKEIEDKLENLMKNFVEAHLEKIQSDIYSKCELLQKKNEELESRIAQQEKALNMMALYILKVNMEQCDLAKVLIALEKTLTGEIFTSEDEKRYLETIQNETLTEAKELFGNFPALSDAVKSIEEAIVELSGQPS